MKIMKKYKITTAKKAVKKGELKENMKFWAEMEVVKTLKGDFAFRFSESDKIRIPIPEPKPIDFGEADRVLMYGDLIIKTTGLKTDSRFSAVVINSHNKKKGYASNDWWIHDEWTDITDTYKPKKR